MPPHQPHVALLRLVAQADFDRFWMYEELMEEQEALDWLRGVLALEDAPDFDQFTERQCLDLIAIIRGFSEAR